MNKIQWIEMVAACMADKLNEPVEAWHLNVGSTWYEDCEGIDITPEEAVDEELSCWGE